MWVKISCSRCGESRRLSTKQVDCVGSAIKAGWGSYGSALYCPKCAKSWHDRNEKPMADESHTAMRIAALVADAVCGRGAE